MARAGALSPHWRGPAGSWRDRRGNTRVNSEDSCTGLGVVPPGQAIGRRRTGTGDAAVATPPALDTAESAGAESEAGETRFGAERLLLGRVGLENPLPLQNSFGIAAFREAISSI